MRQVEHLVRSESAITLERLAAQLEQLEHRIEGRIESLEAHAAAQRDFNQRSEDRDLIEDLGRWIAHAPLRSEPLISVVVPTRDRPAELGRAIASIRTQRYRTWELLIIDDSEPGESPVRIDAIPDPRIRLLQTTGGRGACAARNVALDQAAGPIIAYLDDDNVMDPEWLWAVAWAFENHPDRDVLYGAFQVDNIWRAQGEPGNATPQTFLHRWEPGVLGTTNVADMSAIAHRAELPQARFDEDLVTMGDWDLLVRLTAHQEPLVLPAIACYYTTDSPGRLTESPTSDSDRRLVLDRASSLPAPPA